MYHSSQSVEEKGIEEGRQEARLLAIKNLMKNMKMPIEQALAVLEIREADWEKCQKLLANQKRRFRINAHCPHCGEEHLWLDTTLTEEEEQIYDQFYAEHPNNTVFNDIWGKAPLIVTREIRCGVCHTAFSQNFRICRALDTRYLMRGFGEIPVHEG